jgi:hypothetical protein
VLGLSVGYCVLHKKILNASTSTTCQYHKRKDLALYRVQQVSDIHQQQFNRQGILRLIDGMPVNGEVSDRDEDLGLLRHDEIAELVSDYGTLGTTIESLAQLKRISGARAELALLSLARGYVQNCINRNGTWTSGLHLYWWTKSRLHEEPEIKIADILSTDGLPLERQVTLTSWSVIMLRLTFIDDIVTYAHQEREPLGTVTGLLDQASEAVTTFNIRRLLQWIRKNAVPELDRQLDRKRYIKLSNELHIGLSERV